MTAPQKIYRRPRLLDRAHTGAEKRNTLRKRRQSSSVLGRFAPSGNPMRTLGFPAELKEPLFLWQDDAQLKAHANYAAAKAGDQWAAIELISDISAPLEERVADAARAGNWPQPLIYVAPHAREARGDNAIPQVLAVSLSFNVAVALGFDVEKAERQTHVDQHIVQTTKVYHTGADAMERLIARASFQGQVRRGANYVLVDDVATLGGTLCDLADYIRRGGGNVVAAVVLVNASRSGKLAPAQKIVQRLEENFGHVIRETFRIEPPALTADEAYYLLGFRTAEEIRGRSAKAQQTTDLRLRSKGIYLTQEGGEFRQRAIRQRDRVRFPGASAYSAARWLGPRHRRALLTRTANHHS